MKLALGTAQFGLDYGVANMSGRTTAPEANVVLWRAQKFGLDTLDTAIAYGNSESVLGQSGVDQWNIITKLPPVPPHCDDVEQWVCDQIKQSLGRLRIVQLHGVLLHRPGQLLGHTGSALYAALQNVKNQGLTRKIGISIYAPTELDAILDLFQFDLVQAPLNILDRRLVDSGWAAILHNAGVEVHTRSAFLQGLLLMPASQRPAIFGRWSDVWNIWDRWLGKVGLTPLQACLGYFADLSEIDRVIVGVEKATQLDEIFRATEGRIESPPEFNPLSDDRLINPSTWINL